MLNTIRDFFNARLALDADSDDVAIEQRRRLAAAALMIELMQTDTRVDARENAAFVQILRDNFQLAPDDLALLTECARQEAREATSLYQFTRLINDAYRYEEKVKLIEDLWRIAYADQRLDKYEDSLIRKVAELIHVSHSDFIRTKLAVRPDGS